MSTSKKTQDPQVIPTSVARMSTPESAVSNKAQDLHVLPTPELQRAAQACPLLEGDRAKAEWVACCSQRFSPMAKRIARNDALAEDALQITWIKIVQAANVCLGGRTACPWVARIVVNNIRDLQRQQRSRREIPLADVEHRRPAPDLETDLQEQQLLELVRQMVAMLPDTYRRVYEMRIQEELSTEETAARLGLTKTNVTTTLNRAVKALERNLKKRLKPRRERP